MVAALAPGSFLALALLVAGHRWIDRHLTLQMQVIDSATSPAEPQPEGTLTP
ncbi:MAG: hypothetical protein AAF358_12375 [Pseudomonadota bacterium]